MNNELLLTIDRHLTIKYSEILMLKACINYTNILMEDGRSVLSSRTLRTFEQRLFNQSFFRPNRSVIINLNYMVSYQKEVATIRMGNNESIIISRRRIKGFLKKSRTINDEH
ncbi:LytTR family transcriptional regulator [Emticicia agri]|uniref:LytTR family transcriptional regulator n=2 Tax=Emticicia agri TaxID=2492393 RepID=A0A4V1ZCR7_9BACT|nr:LytTR family transcriptional regulator [Emticicia agri]